MTALGNICTYHKNVIEMIIQKSSFPKCQSITNYKVIFKVLPQCEVLL